jgi:hypothetical protein
VTAGPNGDGGSEEDRGFKVTDRRNPSSEVTETAEADAPHEDGAQSRLPELDFSTFVLSLSASAVLHLGEMPHPETQTSEKNLPLAKQTIDILGMLQDKTRGNLTREEERLLTSILYDLRMKYVEHAKKA